MIEIKQLEERDRKRKVIWQVSPHLEKHGLLLDWTSTEVILAVKTGKQRKPTSIEKANPSEVSFSEER